MFGSHGVWRAMILLTLPVLLAPVMAQCSPATPTIVPTSLPRMTQGSETPMPVATSTVLAISPTPVPPEPSKTPEPSPTVKPVDLTIPEELMITVPEVQLRELNSVTEAKKAKTGFQVIPNANMTQDALIRAMGITDPVLIQLYRQLFTGKAEFSNVNFSGLGIYYTGGEAHGPGRGIGILYGFSRQSQIPENVKQLAESKGFTAQPLWVVLQIKPGKNLTPDRHPDAFIVVSIGLRDQSGIVDAPSVGATVMGLGVPQNGQLALKYVRKDIRPNKSDTIYRVTDTWSITEMIEVFGMRKGTPIFIACTSLEPTRFWGTAFFPIILSFPPPEEQQAHSFSLE